MRILFIDNPDNQAFRTVDLFRRVGIEADLFQPPFRTGQRNDIAADLGVENYAPPSWLREMDGALPKLSHAAALGGRKYVSSWFYALSAFTGQAARLARGYDVIFVAGIWGMLAAARLPGAKTILYPYGADILYTVTEDSYLGRAVRRALKQADMMLTTQTDLYEIGRTFGIPDIRKINYLYHRDLVQVDRAFQTEMEARFANADRVFLYPTRKFFPEPQNERKGTEYFFEAFERLRAARPAARIAVANIEYPTPGWQACLARYAETFPTMHDYTGFAHVPRSQLAALMAMDKTITFNAFEGVSGFCMSGIMREAASLGSPVVSAIDETLIQRQETRQNAAIRCPVTDAHDTDSLFAAMLRFADMDDQTLMGERAGIRDWAADFYERELDAYIQAARDLHSGVKRRR